MKEQGDEAGMMDETSWEGRQAIRQNTAGKADWEDRTQRNCLVRHITRMATILSAWWSVIK